ncbi:hypothetical protein [Sphingobium boeckii]|uniref:Uncharacterized protein n=1 Tax=Sphingobium boeckii TaxID=1082345 RepID=A0A7W9EF43_9SPHN|nr:hypothetical protein [Sphingobium boeckii]MBB5685326.1 hypothetical protein [Sphingobium boeckii]
MKRPHPLLILGIGVAIAAAGLWLWRDQGALVWMSGIVAACF